MRAMCVQQSVALGLAVLMTLSTACLNGEAADLGEVSDGASGENWPFHVAVFDHRPTEDEIQVDFARYLVSVYGKAGLSTVTPSDPVPPLSPGRKLVRIDATTSSITNAGTDGKVVSFDGRWLRSDGKPDSQTFVLDNPNKNDLNQGTVSVFYYVLTVGSVTDRFTEGRITTTTSDGWHCQDIALTESNASGTSRSQSLPFNQWVDAPSITASPWFAGTNSSWLSY